MAWHEVYLIKEAAAGMRRLRGFGEVMSWPGALLKKTISGTQNVMAKALAPKVTTHRQTMLNIKDPEMRQKAWDLYKRDPARWEQVMREQGRLKGTLQKDSAARLLGRTVMLG